MQSQKRKLKTLNICEKIRLIDEVEKGIKKKKIIAAEFEIPPNTLSSILKHKESIKAAFENGAFVSGRKRLKESSFPKLEKVMLEWFKMVQHQNLPISGPIMLIKAEEFAKRLNYLNFKCSQGWLDNFKRCNLIVQKVASGESAGVCNETCDKWRNEHLEKLLNEYSADDIFNADETGLFYKCLPEKTLAFSKEKCHGGKKSKERVTIMVCANMTGTEKLNLLVIGKSEKPRCFSNIKHLPVLYKANKKAWVTSAIYEEWLHKIDRQFKLQNRKVLLFVDNCPAHPKTLKHELTNVRVEFFPPNLTSKLQPMDQGVIKNFKQNYRKRILVKILESTGTTVESSNINLLDCVKIADKAWNEVTTKSIKNCFIKAGFDKRAIEVPEETWDAEDELPLSFLKNLPIETIFGGNQYTFDDYVNVDEDLLVTEYPSEDEIIVNLLQPETHDQENGDSSDSGSESVKLPSMSAVNNAFETISTFLNTQDNVPSEIFGAFDKIERFCENINFKKVKQSCITKYFSNN